MAARTTGSAATHIDVDIATHIDIAVDIDIDTDIDVDSCTVTKLPTWLLRKAVYMESRSLLITIMPLMAFLMSRRLLLMVFSNLFI